MKNVNNISINIEIKASKDKVWKILYTDFGQVGNFNPVIEGSHGISEKQGVGCERQCDLSAGGKKFIKETISGAKEGEMMEVKMVGGKFPMMDMGTVKAAYHLKETNYGTNVTMQMDFKTSPVFMGSLIKGKMKSTLFQTLIGLKYYLETGDIVTKSKFKKISKVYKGLGNLEQFKTKIAA